MAGDEQDTDPPGSQTIVGVVDYFAGMPRPIDMEARSRDGTVEKSGEQNQFKIRVADTMGRRNSAGLLIQKMYSWRGYAPSTGASTSTPNRITLVASSQDQVIGTITVGFDSDVGLLVDELYKEETQQLRDLGRHLCEFTKLAVDNKIRSKRVLGSIFHIACIFSHQLHGCTDIMIEVNPRHVRFYETMLGFTKWGEERINSRVSAPAVLLRLEFSHLQEQVRKFGGQGHLSSEKSFYPYFFSPQEADGIVARLLRTP